MVNFGVGDRSRPLIGSSVLAVRAFSSLDATAWNSSGVTGLYPGLAGAERVRASDKFV